MNRLVGYVLALIVGLILGKFFLSDSRYVRPVTNQAPKLVTEPSKFSVTQRREPKNLFIEIYKRLGIENGDLIKEVNGIQADSTGRVFPEILSGYNLGDLCVKFLRANNLRRSCYKKTANGESVETMSSSEEDLNTLLERAKAQPTIKTKRKIGVLEIKNGDVITAVNGQTVDSPEKAMELYNKLKNQSSDTIEVER